MRLPPTRPRRLLYRLLPKTRQLRLPDKLPPKTQQLRLHNKLPPKTPTTQTPQQTTAQDPTTQTPQQTTTNDPTTQTPQQTTAQDSSTLTAAQTTSQVSTKSRVFSLAKGNGGRNLIGYCLTDHVMETMQMESLIRCTMMCNGLAGCKSFNYIGGVCELNDESKESVGTRYFVQSDGCTYYELAWLFKVIR